MMHSHMECYDSFEASVDWVLILVVMDDALAQRYFDTLLPTKVSLNPCCNG